MLAPLDSNAPPLRLTRRQVMLALAAVMGGVGSVATAPGDCRAAINLPLPPPGDPHFPTLEVFLALSRIVLVQEELDAEVAAKMFEIFKNEPYGLEHIATAYGVLRNEILRRQAQGSNAAPPLSVLGANERWFVGHLVTTWYVGIYYHPDRPTQRITLDGALMYQTVRGLLPLPFYGNTGFGAWAEPPV
jgi:hypothetical protein